MLYFGKQFDLTHVGGDIVPVECDQCGCQYFYELARIGTGSTTAPYGIGSSSAEALAQRHALYDLQKRLVFEAELVPCPKCNWINEELVQGYRQGRYRRAGVLAAGIGVTGVIASLVCAWCISIGPAADRGALPYFLFGGPAIFVFLALSILLLRAWKRGRIQPNRNFPLSPKLPSGSPPALIYNSLTSGFQLASQHDEEIAVNGWHVFQVGRHSLPFVCCDCLEKTTLEHDYKFLAAPGVELNVPCCAGCARVYRRTYRRILSATSAIAFLLGCTPFIAFRFAPEEFWIFITAVFIISLAMGSCVAAKMTVPVTVSYKDSSRGIIKLKFRNPRYASAVKNMNLDLIK